MPSEEKKTDVADTIVKQQARLDALSEENAALKAENEKLKADLVAKDAEVGKRADARASLVIRAKTLVQDPSFKTDGKDDTQIMRDVLVARAPESKKIELAQKLDSSGPQYIAARFDHLLESETERVDSDQKIMDASRKAKGETKPEPRKDGRMSSDDAYKLMLEQTTKKPGAAA